MEKEKLKSIKISESLHRKIMMQKIDFLVSDHKNVTIEDILTLWYDAFAEKE